MQTLNKSQQPAFAGCFLTGEWEMKNNEMKKLALLAITAGLLATTQAEIEATESERSIVDLEYVLAKPSCKAHGGCGGLTASSEHNPAVTIHEDEELESQEDTHEDADDLTIQKELV